MAELYEELERIDAERDQTNDPNKLQDLDYREAEVRDEYRRIMGVEL